MYRYKKQYGDKEYSKQNVNKNDKSTHNNMY